MLRIVWFFLALAAFIEGQTNFDDLKLEFVQTIWRHGDRAALYELYPIFAANWTFGGGGLGELTPLGMSQMKNLGTIYRKKYVEEAEFLSARYVSEEIYIRSTNLNRTIISALSMLYGLYPPGAWNIQGVDYPSVDWQQGFTFVPVHIEDQEVCVQQCDCARFGQLQEKWRELPEVQKVRAKMHALNLRVAALFNVTKNPDSFNAYAEAWRSQRTYFNETLYKVLPFYNEQLYKEALETYAPFKQFMGGHFVNSSIVDNIDISHEVSVIQGGALLNELFDRAKDKALCIKMGQNCTSFLKPIKFYGYSSHDLNTYALLVSLGVADLVKCLDGWPDTGAALTIELYSNPDFDFFVRFLYRDNSLEDFVDITGKVCNKSSCPLEDFEKIALKMKPLPDRDTLCATSLSGSSAGSILAYWIPILLLISVFFVGK